MYRHKILVPVYNSVQYNIIGSMCIMFKKFVHDNLSHDFSARHALRPNLHLHIGTFSLFHKVQKRFLKKGDINIHPLSFA